MPIRFQCQACGRPLGIARRKAGTVITCPGCQANVPVPAAPPEPAGTAAPKPPDRRSRPTRPSAPRPAANGTSSGTRPAQLESMPLFERPDFESLLNPAAKATAPAAPPLKPIPAAPPAAAPQFPPAEIDDDEPDVVLVSRGNLTVVAVVVVVLVALAFAAGYIIAAMTLPAAGPK